MAPRTPKWSKVIRSYIIGELAIKTKIKDIYSEVTSSDFEEEHGIKPIDGSLESYGVFLRKCRDVPEEEIKSAYEEYKLEFDSIRWASEKARVQGLGIQVDRLMKVCDVVDKILESGTVNEDSIKMLTVSTSEIRALLEQIRKERSSDADRRALIESGQNKLLIANPQNIEITGELLKELIMMCRTDMGGLHNLDFTILDIKELQAVKESINKAIEFKLNTMPQIENPEIKNEI
ncbi:MAG: hypothetical protein QQN41_06145 [Nitrosopumilus sp.]